MVKDAYRERFSSHRQSGELKIFRVRCDFTHTHSHTWAVFFRTLDSMWAALKERQWHCEFLNCIGTQTLNTWSSLEAIPPVRNSLELQNLRQTAAQYWDPWGEFAIRCAILVLRNVFQIGLTQLDCQTRRIQALVELTLMYAISQYQYEKLFASLRIQSRTSAEHNLPLDEQVSWVSTAQTWKLWNNSLRALSKTQPFSQSHCQNLPETLHVHSTRDPDSITVD